uniref:Uncharacterized protein n=1 Tax=Bubo bubo TaxID=30461 RepID=A0A8C0FMX1_BUBBB
LEVGGRCSKGNDGVGEDKKGSFETGRRHYVEKPQKGIYLQKSRWMSLPRCRNLNLSPALSAKRNALHCTMV